MRSALCILAAGLLASCSSINYVGIETYNPAEITFPDNVSKILVVNHAVPQPTDVGCQFSLFGVKQDTCRMKTDSALMDACRGLGKAMVDGAYFDDVLLYHDPVRRDDVYYEDPKMTPSEVSALCRETGADAVVSLDRLLFETKKDVVAFADGFLTGDIGVKMSGVLRSYVPGRENPLATVYVADSLFFSEMAYSLDLLDQVLPSMEDAARISGEYLGSKSSPNFVPHWSNDTRWFYTGMGALWKEASAYAQAEKWDKATERWEHLYNKSGNWKTKAKAASNIALGYEMKSELKEAHEWASKSYDLFKKNEGEDSRDANLLQLYVEALLKRIRSDRKLNMQVGESQ